MSEFDQFIGTRPATGRYALDSIALERWFTEHIENFSGPLRIEMFKGGQSNPSYKLTTPKKKYVMRSKPGPSSELLPSAHAIEREFRVMQSLGGTAVPVPAMLALCEDESVLGRAFYVMEHVEGRVLWNQSLPDLGKADRAAIYDEMNRVISALHTVDYAQLGLADFGKPGNYFERQIGRWSRQYRASVTEPIAEMDRLMEWLPANIPPMARDPKMVSIVHGDYRMDNLMFATQGAEVLAVLDWELSTLGHPLADFSYHCMAWHIPPGDFRGIGGLDLGTLGIPTESEYIRKYCDRTGWASPQDLMADWCFYLSYNLFRMAAILQGIAKRANDGTASSADARRSAAGAVPLAKMAWAFAQKA